MLRKLLITFREKICFLLKVVLSLYHANEVITLLELPLK